MENSQNNIPSQPARFSAELTLLKALIWSASYREKIASMFNISDFSKELGAVFAVVVNLIKNKEELSKNSIEQKLNRPLPVTLFDFAPLSSEIEKAIDILSKTVGAQRKTLEIFYLWKKKIEELNLRVEGGTLELKQWAEAIKGMFGENKADSPEQAKKIAELEKNLQEVKISFEESAKKLSLKEAELAEKTKELTETEKELEEIEKELLEEKKLNKLQERKNEELKKEQPKAQNAPFLPSSGTITTVIKTETGINNYWDVVFSRLRDSRRPYVTELLTGFEELDKRLGGLTGISLLYGPPKKGKTSLALQLSFETVANNDSFLIYYTTDNRPEALYCRLIAQLSGINPKVILSGNLNNLDEIEKKMFWQSTDFINSLSNRIHIIGIDSIPKNYGELKKQIDSVSELSGMNTGLITVDSFPVFSECIDISSDVNRLSETMTMLRKMQTMYNICVLGVSYTDSSSELNRIRYMADNIYDMRFNVGKTPGDNSHGNVLKDGAVDLWVSSREFGEFYVPLMMSRESLLFTPRTKSFKARPIVWEKRKSAKTADSDVDNQAGEHGDAYTELLHNSVDKSVRK